MAYDEDVANRVREALAEQDGVDERKMFGGLVFMVHGHMCCGAMRDDLMVRVGPEQYEEALTQPHSRAINLTGNPMRGMVYVSPEGIASDADLAAWIGRGLAFVATLPPK